MLILSNYLSKDKEDNAQYENLVSISPFKLKK